MQKILKSVKIWQLQKV